MVTDGVTIIKTDMPMELLMNLQMVQLRALHLVLVMKLNLVQMKVDQIH